jgi:hypothetical protein
MIAVFVSLPIVERLTRESFPTAPLCIGPDRCYRLLSVSGPIDVVEYRDIDDELIAAIYPFENETNAKDWIKKDVCERHLRLSSTKVGNA